MLIFFPIPIYEMRMGLSIIYFKGNFQILINFYSWRLFGQSKKCRSRWNATLCGISSGSSLFAKLSVYGFPKYKRLIPSLFLHLFFIMWEAVYSGSITLKKICIYFCCWWISCYARRQTVSLMHAESRLISIWYSSNAYLVPLETANQRTPWIFKRAIRLELP